MKKRQNHDAGSRKYVSYKCFLPWNWRLVFVLVPRMGNPPGDAYFITFIVRSAFLMI